MPVEVPVRSDEEDTLSGEPVSEVLGHRGTSFKTFFQSAHFSPELKVHLEELRSPDSSSRLHNDDPAVLLAGTYPNPDYGPFASLQKKLMREFRSSRATHNRATRIEIEIQIQTSE